MKYWKIFLILVPMLIFHASIFGEEKLLPPSDHFIKVKGLAEEGDAKAQCELADYYYYGGPYAHQNRWMAANLYEKSASQGHAEAQYSLGLCYYYGSGRTEDPEKAMFWWKKAATQGYSEASYWLGVRYYNGDKVVRSYSDALKWITLAAQDGYDLARAFLGTIYMEGRAVEKDNIKAYAWLNLVSGWPEYEELRDKLEERMPLSDVLEAQRLSKQLLEKYGETKKHSEINK